MGLFDRKSITQQQQDIINRNVAVEDTSGVTIAGSERVSVNLTDAGAIGGIRDTALGAIKANQGGLRESLDFGRNALLGVGAAFEQAGAQTQRVLETTTGKGPSVITDNTIKFGIVAAAVALVVINMRN